MIRLLCFEPAYLDLNFRREGGILKGPGQWRAVPIIVLLRRDQLISNVSQENKQCHTSEQHVNLPFTSETGGTIALSFSRHKVSVPLSWEYHATH